jgi:hypothetical protein
MQEIRKHEGLTPEELEEHTVEGSAGRVRPGQPGIFPFLTAACRRPPARHLVAEHINKEEGRPFGRPFLLFFRFWIA